jgi:hypothetical protein
MRGTLEGKRPLGRSRHRRMDDIKINGLDYSGSGFGPMEGS